MSSIIFAPRPNGFTFTNLLAPEIICIVPSAFLLIAAPCRFAQLYSKSAITRSGWLLYSKVTFSTILFVLQSVLLALLLSDDSPTTLHNVGTSLSLIAASSVAILSYLEHRRAIQPSAVLAGYLWLATLLGLPQTISSYERPPSGNRLHFSVLLAIEATRAILIVLEEWPKRNCLPGSIEDWSAEETSGPLCRLTFWWLNSLFLKGYKSQLRVKDLGKIDGAFSSQDLLCRMEEALDKANPSSKYYLVGATWSALKWPFLMPVVPRLLQAVFRFGQPILINRVIKFLGEPRTADSASVANNLVLATAVVYLGLAVSRYRSMKYLQT